MTKLAKNFDVLKPYDFLQDFMLEVDKAKQRVWVQTMYIRPGAVATEVFRTLKKAVSKGIDTKIHIDWYDLLTKGRYPDRQNQVKEQTLSDLQTRGVLILFTNPPTLLERMLCYKGRNHMKITIVDDIAYVGGVNFADADFSYLDFMVKISDKLIVSKIADQFMDIHSHQLSSDKQMHIDHETTLLIDAGKPGRSIILDNAVRLIKHAKRSIFHVSHLMPDGKFLQALHTMHGKSIKVEAVVPLKGRSPTIFALLHKINEIEMRIRNRTIPILYCPSMIHAKLTIIDEKIALLGSHNMSEKSVKMGTGEITIQSSNKILVKNLLDFYSRLRTLS